MNDEQSKTGLGRGHFLAILGKTALGLWVLNMLPNSLAAVRPLRPKKTKTPAMAARIKAHPQAVARKQRG